MRRTVGLQSLTRAHEKMSSTLFLANFSKRFVLSLFVCWVKGAARFSVYLHCYGDTSELEHWMIPFGLYLWVACWHAWAMFCAPKMLPKCFPNIHTLIIFLWKIPASKKENLCVCQPISQKSVAPLWYQNWHCINFFFWMTPTTNQAFDVVKHMVRGIVAWWRLHYHRIQISEWNCSDHCMLNPSMVLSGVILPTSDLCHLLHLSHFCPPSSRPFSASTSPSLPPGGQWEILTSFACSDGLYPSLSSISCLSSLVIQLFDLWKLKRTKPSGGQSNSGSAQTLRSGYD